MSGPVFVQEPPNQVDFSNTTGAEIICQSRGTPLPKITWVKTDGTIIKDVPGLRQVGLLHLTKAEFLLLKPRPFTCMRNFSDKKVGNRKY